MPIFPLRDYQDYVVDTVRNWIKYRAGENGYIKAAGGSGKSVMIAATAEFCFDIGKRVVVLARNEKLLTQNKAKFAEKYQQHIGIYCAGIGEKDAGKPITIASIQSIYAVLLEPFPEIIIIDEVQNLHPDDEGDTQYWQFIRNHGNPQIIGFTATDFRTGSGELQFGEKIADIPIKPLMERNFLVPPINKSLAPPDLSNVYVIRGEYNNQQLEDVYLEPELLGRSLEALRKYAHDRNSVVIFAQSRNHGKILQQAMFDNDMDAVFVDGETPKDELAHILERFEDRQFKYLINVALLVEGWDCPSVDCVAIFAATMSKGKFEQIVYRGTRLAPHLGKENFMVIDLGGNFERHGALGSPLRDKGGKEAKKPSGRICPSCETFCELKATQCPDCGYEFPPAELRQVSHKSNVDSESDTVYEAQPLVTYDVRGVLYKEHKSKKGNVTLRVDYYCDTKYGKISEYLSPYSSSEWAKNNAWKFFKDRGKDIYGGIENYKMDDLLFYAETLKKPTQIVVDHNEQFPRVKDYIWHEEDRASDTKSIGDLDAADFEGDFIPFAYLIACALSGAMILMQYPSGILSYV